MRGKGYDVIERFMACVATRICTIVTDGRLHRIIYRLWQTTDGGHLIEAAQVADHACLGAVDRHAVWVDRPTTAEELFRRVASDTDPVLPIHLPDVARDVLWREHRRSRRTAAQARREAVSAALGRGRAREALAARSGV